MLIKVLKTTKGATNASGTQVMDYLKGQTYDIFDHLANVFIKNGWGAPVEVEGKAISDLANKAISVSPENKSIQNKKNKTKGKE